MTRDEFIEWMETTMFEGSDSSWRMEVDYANMGYDYIDVDQDTATYRWEELYWGGRDWRECELPFDEFVNAYNSDTIKY